MRGSHGTCKTFAASVLANGFNPSAEGRLGPGIYFWRISADAPGTISGRKRAKDWHWNAKRMRDSPYAKAPDKSCAVLFAEIEESNVLSLDNDNVLNKFSRFFEVAIRKYQAASPEGITDTIQSNIHDEFVDFLLEEGGVIDVVTGPIQMVRRGKFGIANARPFWPGIVVRNKDAIKEVVLDTGR